MNKLRILATKRLTYIYQESKALAKSFFLYQSKDGQKEKAFDVLEWLAAMYSHVPNKGEQMVRYGVYPPLAELL